MCPPGHASSRDPFTGRHIGRPLQILSETSSCPRSRAGTEPRPYRRQRRRMPNAGSRSTRPSSTSSSASQNARNDRRHQSLRLPSPVPTSPVKRAQRSARARLPEIPCDPGMVSKGRAAALPLVVSRGSGGEIRKPPIFIGTPGGVWSPRPTGAHSAFDRNQSPGCHPPAGAWTSRGLTPPVL